MVFIYHNHIEAENVEIYGSVLEDDHIGAGYNIGDLLNIPSLGGYWLANPHNSYEDLERLYKVGMYYQKSVLNYYIEARPPCEVVPYKHRVLGAVNKYILHSTDHLRTVLDTVNKADVLCVHVRCGDKPVEDDFIHLIESQSSLYRQVYIFSGLHLDERFATNTQKKSSFCNAMNRLLAKPNISLIVASPDDHLSLMMYAANLLVHKGGFSALGIIVCRGCVFATKYMDILNSIWSTKVDKKHVMLHCE